MRDISAALNLNPRSVRNIGNRYLESGLQRAINDATRPGKRSIVDGHQEKEIVALACSAPPGERARWTLELLRQQIIKRGIVESIGKETLRTFLHKARVKPWLEKKLVHWGADRRIHQANGGNS